VNHHQLSLIVAEVAHFNNGPCAVLYSVYSLVLSCPSMCCPLLGVLSCTLLSLRRRRHIVSDFDRTCVNVTYMRQKYSALQG